MTGIVERLRHRINDAPMPTEHLLDEAADTIEGLLAALELARVYLTDFEGLPLWDNDNPLIQIDAAIAKAKAS